MAILTHQALGSLAACCSSCEHGQPCAGLGFDMSGMSSAIASLASIAGIGLQVWETVSSVQLAKAAQNLSRDALNFKKAQAMAELAALKQQEERGVIPATTFGGGVPNTWLIGGGVAFLGLLAVLVLRKR